MKAKEKTEQAGYWFQRDNRGGAHCGMPVATRNPKGVLVGEQGSRPRKAARRRYKTLLEAGSIKATGFKVWFSAWEHA